MSDFDGGWIKTTEGTFIAIDPEDAEQVERLARAWSNVEGVDLDSEKPMSVLAYRMRDALREFARPTPPKPDEPQGLGAVVEGADGKQWVRTDSAPDRPWWTYPGITAHYDYIDAVRVLSEGVQA